MGNFLERSRQEKVDIEKATKNRTVRFWEEPKYNPHRYEETTLETFTLERANKHLADVDLPKLKILEVCAGSGIASNIVLPNADIIKTDLFESVSNNVIACDSKTAVEKYGNDCNALLLISPPPNVYADYYAIRTFEELNIDKIKNNSAEEKSTEQTTITEIKSTEEKNTKKYLIYIGELGASDGGDGMYQYLLGDDTKWNLMHRAMLSLGKDGFGGNCEKELFVFELKV
jgi:hypothetical protein